MANGHWHAGAGAGLAWAASPWRSHSSRRRSCCGAPKSRDGLPPRAADDGSGQSWMPFPSAAQPVSTAPRLPAHGPSWLVRLFTDWAVQWFTEEVGVAVVARVLLDHGVGDALHLAAGPCSSRSNVMVPDSRVSGRPAARAGEDRRRMAVVRVERATA